MLSIPLTANCGSSAHTPAHNNGGKQLPKRKIRVTVDKFMSDTFRRSSCQLYKKLRIKSIDGIPI